MKKGNEPNRLPGYVGMIVLSVLGLILSAELLRIHLTVATDPFHPFACHVNAEVDCNAVALSPQAVLLGVPVPIWGLLTYLFIGAAAIIGPRSRRAPWKNAADYGMLAALWSGVYSLYLAYISAFVIKVFCLYCAGLYVVNVGMVFFSLAAARPLGEFGKRRVEDLKWASSSTLASGSVGALFFAAAIVVSGLWVWSDQPEVIDIGAGAKIDISQDPMLGNPRAPVTIIEFSDYQCPACKKMHLVVAEVLKKYNTSVRLIHKNFPLDSQCNPDVHTRMHERACAAAITAECAFELGKYKQVADMMWETDDLSDNNLLMIADKAGIDRDRFIECIKGEKARKAILDDVDAAKAVGVKATPTFVINGYRFTGVKDLEWCSNFIDKLLRGEKPNSKTLDEGE